MTHIPNIPELQGAYEQIEKILAGKGDHQKFYDDYQPASLKPPIDWLLNHAINPIDPYVWLDDATEEQNLADQRIHYWNEIQNYRASWMRNLNKFSNNAHRLLRDLANFPGNEEGNPPAVPYDEAEENAKAAKAKKAAEAPPPPTDPPPPK